MKKKAMAGIFFLTGIAILATAGGMPLSEAQAARIKDIAAISGVRENHLLGYGMIVGLAGTGDDVKNGFTKESLSNLLSRQGLTMKDKDVKADNVAAVMVTASLPPFAKIGARIDVTVSSVGNAKSLQGGTLLMTPLKGT
ncbi:MAG: flagellar basal body P-ring protein FlgI, partial [Proteobacteria bacterium]|nr:flagellar basal body P-ring protein FlgI [Pseudomonadota bacterium]